LREKNLLAAGLLMLICRAAGMDAGGDLLWIRRHGGDAGLLMGQVAAAHFASHFLFFPLFSPTHTAEKCFVLVERDCREIG
jgi:hypothetical protein